MCSSHPSILFPPPQGSPFGNFKFDFEIILFFFYK